MKITKVVALAVMATLASSSFLVAQDDVAKFGKFTIRKVDEGPLNFFGTGTPKLSPTVGSVYAHVIASNIEDSLTGLDIGSGGVIANIVDTVMDGEPEVTGQDLSDVFGNPAANDVIACEILEPLGFDAASGMFRYTLTISLRSTATMIEFDSLDMDLQDPADIGFDADGDGTITLAEGAGDGVTGKGLDGVFGTADDVPAMDGFFDTGDGVADAPFPLLPPFLVFAVDSNMNMDTTDDAGSAASGITIFVGDMDAPVLFDNLGTVESAFIGWFDMDGNPADIDGDGIGDDLSGLDLVTIQVFGDDFNPPLAGSWDGVIGATFGVDENLCSTNELTVGTVYEQTFTMTFQSSDDVEGFGNCDFDDACPDIPGDINGDGAVTLLDVGPFVNLVTGADPFNCAGDFTGPDGTPDGAVTLLDVGPFVGSIGG